MAYAVKAVAVSCCVLTLGLSLAATQSQGQTAQTRQQVQQTKWRSDFQGYEVRVIRPRYFTKAERLELGAGLSTVMNQSFIYSYLATGILAWHAWETLAVEVQAAYGRSFDREETRNLADDFDIHTVVLRTESLANGRLVWTPSYGKYHLSAARIVYFDTYLTAGVGSTAVRYRFNHCEGQTTSHSDKLKSYPTGIIGVGQRHFVDKNTSFRLGAELQRFMVNSADGACEPAAGTNSAHDSVILFLGGSRFL